MSEWLSMGGYGVFVWGAYITTLSILILNVLWSRLTRRKILKQLKLFFARLTQ